MQNSALRTVTNVCTQPCSLSDMIATKPLVDSLVAIIKHSQHHDSRGLACSAMAVLLRGYANLLEFFDLKYGPGMLVPGLPSSPSDS